MSTSSKVWINGEIKDSTEVSLFPFNQAINYGATVYKGIRMYGTKSGPALFRLDEHLERLAYSAQTLRMQTRWKKDDLKQAIIDTVIANDLKSGYIRPLLFYSEQKMGINILGSEVTTLILTWPWEDRTESKKVTLSISTYKRLDPSTVDLKAKISGYYANGLLGFIQAREDGYDEPLFLDKDGFVAEGAVNNIFAIKKDTLYTPTTKSILAGITRETVIQIAGKTGLSVEEKDIRPEDLTDMDELFLTGTGIELELVSEVKDYHQNNAGWSRTQALKDYYRQVTQGEVPEYRKWLTHVV